MMAILLLLAFKTNALLFACLLTALVGSVACSRVKDIVVATVAASDKIQVLLSPSLLNSSDRLMISQR
uniref:Putative secreted protein n=1 Tax=Anopheles darlingi TaxID=43151 RepID=A0A2M4D2F2_ANODA